MSNALGVFWYIPGEQETPMLIRTFQVDEVEDAREYATAHKDCDEHEVFYAQCKVRLPKHSRRHYIK